MDDSPIPRCNFNFFAMLICVFLAFVIAMQINVSTYGNIDDTNCFSFTSAFEYEDIGITGYIGIIDVPICCCAFFALKMQKRKTEIKAIDPPSCRYAKILNC